jgi:hypothetical protein
MALPSTTAPDTTVDMHIPAPSDHTSTPIIHRAIIYIADLFAPAPVRAYYLVFLHSVDRWKTAYSVVVLGIALAVAEWEQPGYLPGPGEVGDMLVCFTKFLSYRFPLFSTHLCVTVLKILWRKKAGR